VKPSGLFIIFTGKGKGKTTAALGTVIRSLGYQKKTSVIQFIKGKWNTGERQFLSRHLTQVDYHVMGAGFTWESDDPARDRTAAYQAWDTAAAKMTSGEYDLVVLDELTYVTHYGWLDEEEILEGLNRRHPDCHVLVTGRHAPASWVEQADLVSRIEVVKHPFEKGFKAVKGIDY